jgi:hypothetical protein
MEIKISDKCVFCNGGLSFSAKAKSIKIGDLYFSIGKIAVKECKSCLEVFEDEVTVRQYKNKVLQEFLVKMKEPNFQMKGESCFWIRQAIFLSREELAEYGDESAIKSTEQQNEVLSTYIVGKLKDFINRYFEKQLILG